MSVLEDLGPDLAMMARLVQSQLMNAMTAFFQRDTALARRVMDKDDQIDNLLGLIEEKCFARIAGEAADSPRSRRLRGVFRVALNLEKLGDYAVTIACCARLAARCYPRQPRVNRPAPSPTPRALLTADDRAALAAMDRTRCGTSSGNPTWTWTRSTGRARSI